MYPMRYACRELRSQVKPGSSHAFLTKLDVPILDNSQTVDSSPTHGEAALRCLEPLLLDVQPLRGVLLTHPM